MTIAKKLIAAAVSAVIMAVSVIPMNAGAASDKGVKQVYVEKTEIPLSKLGLKADKIKYPSVLTSFKEKSGTLTFLVRYNKEDSDDKEILLIRLDKSFNIKKKIKIKPLYPLFGNATCDEDGNYYFAWGKKVENQNEAAMAITKFDHNGKLIKTTESYHSETGYSSGFKTKVPFDAGGCAIAVNNGVVVCNYARLMFNGHQSSTTFAVRTSDMKDISTKYITYTSHSFQQDAKAVSDGDFIFCNRGDAYPRGFDIYRNNSSKNIVPFHFYGDTGYNHTGSSLGGVEEVKDGYLLIGSSAKGMDLYGGQYIFVQKIDKKLKKVISKGKTRKYAKGKTDSGVIWISDNKNAYVHSVNELKIDDTHIFVSWTLNEKSKDQENYGAIISDEGKVIQKFRLPDIISTNRNHLSYHKGNIIWTDSRVTDRINIYSIPLTKSKKLKTIEMSGIKSVYYKVGLKASQIPVKVKVNGKVLKYGTDYTCEVSSDSYNNNDNGYYSDYGVAIVYKKDIDNDIFVGDRILTINGKGKYKGLITGGKFTVKWMPPKLKAKKVSNSEVILDWSWDFGQPKGKITGDYIDYSGKKLGTLALQYIPEHYEIYMSVNGGKYGKVSTVSGSVTSVSLKKLDLTKNKYKFVIKPDSSFTERGYIDNSYYYMIFSDTYADYPFSNQAIAK